MARLETTVQEQIQLLINNAKTAYDCSMPLMASAQIADRGLYKQALEKAKSLFGEKKLTDKTISQQAWIYSRIIYAAAKIADGNTQNEYSKLVENQLLVHKQVVQDQYFIWTLGWLTAADPQRFKQKATNDEDEKRSTNEMLSELADQRDKIYHDSIADDSLSSETVWISVMNIQAAALADDRQAYFKYFNQLLALAPKTKLVIDAIDNVLNLLPKTDYPAWAMSIIYNAGVKFHSADFPNASESLCAQVQKSLTAGQLADVVMAKTTAPLLFQEKASLVVSSVPAFGR